MFYPIHCFWFLNSNLQCQNLLFSLCLNNDILGNLRVNLLCPQLRRSWRGILVSGCPCVRASVRQKLCMLGFWNFIYGFLVEKHLTHVFYSCPSYLPFWSYAPLNKIRMKSDACHILWTVHARVLKFYIWIPHGKVADSYFFLVLVISPSGVMPL